MILRGNATSPLCDVLPSEISNENDSLFVPGLLTFRVAQSVEGQGNNLRVAGSNFEPVTFNFFCGIL